ncbi:prefoldin subunit 1 [Toxorhynchites rutilus septentrionalis]|uniref:prefoldin subunit 1 n=1 Tax=Toxorhynchites rutilus septentrionalis TaxID=329112 RepID=UPI0024799065|nr:prefoldin subunit 1 [Toxorhynchites rutilus septentrionalis]
MDLELKKAFTEMQFNKIESTKKIRLLDMKTDSLKVSKQRVELTNKEVSKLNTDTKVYASVGRMFVLSDVPSLSAEMKSKQSNYEEMIGQCEKSKEFVLKNLKEQEDSLRELVQQRRMESTAKENGSNEKKD